MAYYKCGCYASLSNRIIGRVHDDSAVENLLLESIYPHIICYGCLKKLYNENPDYVEPGFKPWVASSGLNKRAYGHFLRSIAILCNIPCKRESIYPGYFIDTVFDLGYDENGEPKNKPVYPKLNLGPDDLWHPGKDK